ncbi:ANTAR domain-containing protein [Kineococcus sp. R86509]|uniref:ANTAR domain-containing protein n=1 Tax=Kineococcus sp. R86509 TaxID=3093851 RepID=UPI0036D3473A
MTRSDFLATPEPGAPDAAIDDFVLLQTRIRELEQETATLRAGLESRQHLGFVTGVLAQRYGLDPDQAWNLLTQVSQHLNVKARRVAQVMLDAYRGELDTTDAALATSIARLLPQTAVPGGNHAAGSRARELPTGQSPDPDST